MLLSIEPDGPVPIYQQIRDRTAPPEDGSTGREDRP
jgi:hypothetical protein